MVQKPPPAYEGDEPYIFVSYSHEDAHALYGELLWLEERGFRFFYDQGITPGSEWSEALAERISGCTWFLFFITARSVKSEHCRRELNFAIEEGCNILAVHLEEIEVPAGIRLSLNNRQAIHRWQLDDSSYHHRLENVLGSRLAERSKAAQPVTLTSRQPRDSNRRTPLLVLPTIALIGLVIAVLVYRPFEDAAEVELAHIRSLASQGLNFDAFLALQRSSLKDKPAWQDLMDEVALPASINTEPPQARVRIKAYGGTQEEYVDLGTTPLRDRYLPKGTVDLTLEAPDSTPVRVAALNPSPYFHNSPPLPDAWEVPLDIPLPKDGDVPPGMVMVPETTLDGALLSGSMIVRVPAFYIDRHEVTNSDYKRFVEAGGYEDPSYWQDLPVDNAYEEQVEPNDLRDTLIDSTGRIGPASWELGNFPVGEEDLPVTGVSWLEAAAYCRHVGKELPTAYHWARAAFGISVFYPAWQASVSVANFDSAELMPVEASGSLGPFGTLDMPGNAIEWVWNRQNDKRLTLGGSYRGPAKLFSAAQPRDAFDRSTDLGFRCARYLTPPDPGLAADISKRTRNVATAKPISDEQFDLLKQQHVYASSELNATVLSSELHGNLVHEIVEMDTGYDDGRLRIYIFRPTGEGPFDSLIWFGGRGDFASTHASEPALTREHDTHLSFIANSGRALIMPVLYGSFERYDGAEEALARGPQQWQAATTIRMLRWRQDVGRIIDYLEQRDSFNGDAVGFIGLSNGAIFCANLLALEPRFSSAILMSGGIWNGPFFAPSYDALNFLPRIKLPVLMLTGENDFVVSVDDVQIPTFARLSTEHKRHVIFENTGHWPFPHKAFVREVGDWLDLWLRPDP